MHAFWIVSSAVLFCIFNAGSAGAASKAARYLQNEAIASACPSGGAFSPGSVVERDLTGDGKLDLIIDLWGLNCNGGAPNLNCGVMCDVDIYVREDGLLNKKNAFNATGMTGVLPGNPPEINMMGRDGSAWSVHWNGTEFVP